MQRFLDGAEMGNARLMARHAVESYADGALIGDPRLHDLEAKLLKVIYRLPVAPSDTFLSYCTELHGYCLRARKFCNEVLGWLQAEKDGDKELQRALAQEHSKVLADIADGGAQITILAGQASSAPRGTPTGSACPLLQLPGPRQAQVTPLPDRA